MTRIFLKATLLALVSACSSISVESSSKALQVAKAMGVPAKDMSRENWREMITKQGHSAEAAARGEIVMSGLQSWASNSPTSFLLSGLGPKKIAASIHIVAWIPERLVSSPQEAKLLAEKHLKMARATALANTDAERSDILNQKIQYIMTIPYGESGPIHALEQMKQLAVGAEPKLIAAPKFLEETQNVYGPIFLGINGGISEKKEIEKITKISASLPKWFYIYNPGLKGIFPNTILNKGIHSLFLEQPTNKENRHQ